MSVPVHMAITRRIRKECVAEYEKELVAFAARSLSDPRSRGVHLIYPTPGAEAPEYGILRSFASAEDRDAFYASDFYKDWTASVQHMQEGGPVFRELSGLEAWFRNPHGGMPPRWKMATLTWLAVWPVSMTVGHFVGPLLTPHLPFLLKGAVIAALIVLVLTWAAMPLLIKLAHPWLHPEPKNK